MSQRTFEQADPSIFSERGMRDVARKLDAAVAAIRASRERAAEDIREIKRLKAATRSNLDKIERRLPK
jgi:pyruvate kinase